MGFNAASASGNQGAWTCAGGTSFRAPGTVFRDRLSASPTAQLFQTIIPACPPGAATVTLLDTSTGGSAGPFTITVSTAAAVPNPATAAANLATQLGRLLNALPPTGVDTTDGALEGARGAAGDSAAATAGASAEEGALEVEAALRDVGTLGPTDVLGARGFDVPTLLGLHATAPYLHDGSAATLGLVLANPRRVALPRSAADTADLLAFLASIDGSTPPAAARP